MMANLNDKGSRKAKWIDAVEKNPIVFRKGSDRVRNDKEIAIKAWDATKRLGFEYGVDYHDFGEALRNDPDFFLECLRIDGRCLENDVFGYCFEKEHVITAVKTYPFAYKWGCERLRHDKDIVLHAVLGDPSVLAMVPPHFRDDESIIRLALEKNGMALEFASDRLRRDPSLVKHAIKSQHYDNYSDTPLKFAMTTALGDEEVMLSAIKRGVGCPLKYAGPGLKRSIPLFQAGIRLDPYCIMYANHNVRQDYETVKMAVEKDGGTLMWAMAPLTKKRALVETVLRTDGLSLKYAHKELQSQEQIVLQATRQNPAAFEYATARMKKSLTLVKQLFAQENGCTDEVAWKEAFRHCHQSLKDKRQIVHLAVKRTGRILLQTRAFQQDKELLLEAMKTCPEILTKICEQRDENNEPYGSGLWNLLEDQDVWAACIQYTIKLAASGEEDTIRHQLRESIGHRMRHSVMAHSIHQIGTWIQMRGISDQMDEIESIIQGYHRRVSFRMGVIRKGLDKYNLSGEVTNVIASYLEEMIHPHMISHAHCRYFEDIRWIRQARELSAVLEAGKTNRQDLEFNSNPSFIINVLDELIDEDEDSRSGDEDMF